ncbi:hypothetical protein JXD20_02075 [Candidatus Peregrinibacteria bacterium]|nr:hypothetical protein [Candidatus Peregrinibacteria bacterium]
MAKDQSTTTATATDDKKVLSIPADISERFGDLVELIKGSRSMDDSERQYWIDVLPIMSDDQIQNLRDILDNEKKQLAEAEAAYSEGTQDNFLQTAHKFDEEIYKEKKRARMEAEKLYEKEEIENEAAVLKELENL